LIVHVYSYLVVSAVLIVTPGPDTALTIRNSLTGGARSGVATAAGVCAGQVVWGLASSLGVAALVAASHPVFVAIQVSGAIYLTYLGAQALRSAGKRTSTLEHRSLPVELEDKGDDAYSRRAFRQGLLSNLGNPKMAFFFISLLPQFTSARAPAFIQLLLLGIVFSAMTFTWLSAYATAIERFGDVVRRPRVRRRLEAMTGIALIALGVRVTADVYR
jgi:threonine/homoserine/homoserine lactone efflux protein